MTEITYEQEMAFAREFYTKAVEGLEPHEYPPTPDEWVENGEILTKEWEFAKAELIGMAEAETTTEEQKEDIEAFLKCTLSVYVDLMSSICATFINEQGEILDSVKIKPHEAKAPLLEKVTVC